jgi:hypothetical protein
MDNRRPAIIQWILKKGGQALLRLPPRFIISVAKKR